MARCATKFPPKAAGFPPETNWSAGAWCFWVAGCATGEFYAAESLWPDRLLAALQQTQHVRDGFVASAILDPAQRARLLAASAPKTLLDEIMSRKETAPRDNAGLAQFLAE